MRAWLTLVEDHSCITPTPQSQRPVSHPGSRYVSPSSQPKPNYECQRGAIYNIQYRDTHGSRHLIFMDSIGHPTIHPYPSERGTRRTESEAGFQNPEPFLVSNSPPPPSFPRAPALAYPCIASASLRPIRHGHPPPGDPQEQAFRREPRLASFCVQKGHMSLQTFRVAFGRSIVAVPTRHIVFPLKHSHLNNPRQKKKKTATL